MTPKKIRRGISKILTNLLTIVGALCIALAVMGDVSGDFSHFITVKSQYFLMGILLISLPIMFSKIRKILIRKTK